MQKSLRELFIHYSPRNPDVLWVDVDCTPIYVYGNQENKEYSSHYRDYCLMAMVFCKVRSLYTYFYNLASQQVQKKGTNLNSWLADPYRLPEYSRGHFQTGVRKDNFTILLIAHKGVVDLF